jgi:putative membrane protein
MKRTLFLGVLLAGVCSLRAQPPAQPQQQQPQSQPGYPPGRSPGMGRSTDPVTGDIARDGMPIKIDDKAFLKRVAVDNMMQMELGKLAAEKGSSDAVKQYGRKMADDRQKAHEELTQLASKQGVTVPDALDSKHKGKVDKLAKLDGQNFDKAFLKEVTHDNGEDVADFQAEANGGSDAAVKSFATRVLPMIQAHAQMARDIQSGRGAQDQPR